MLTPSLCEKSLRTLQLFARTDGTTVHIRVADRARRNGQHPVAVRTFDLCGRTVNLLTIYRLAIGAVKRKLDGHWPISEVGFLPVPHTDLKPDKSWPVDLTAISQPRMSVREFYRHQTTLRIAISHDIP